MIYSASFKTSTATKELRKWISSFFSIDDCQGNMLTVPISNFNVTQHSCASIENNVFISHLKYTQWYFLCLVYEDQHLSLRVYLQYGAQFGSLRVILHNSYIDLEMVSLGLFLACSYKIVVMKKIENGVRLENT